MNSFNGATLFKLSKSHSGAFEYQFNEAGTYYYGGVANSASNIFMRGTIVVADATDASESVSLKINGFEALYPVSIEKSDDRRRINLLYVYVTRMEL